MPKKKQKLVDFKLPKLQPMKADWYSDDMQQEKAALDLVKLHKLDLNLVIRATGMKTLPNYDETMTEEETRYYVRDHLLDDDSPEKIERCLSAIKQLSGSLLERWEEEGVVRGEAKAVPTVVEPALIKYLSMLMVEHCYAQGLVMPYDLVDLLRKILDSDQFHLNRINLSGSQAKEAERRIIAFVTANLDRRYTHEIICEYVALDGTAKTSKSQVSAVLKRHEELIKSIKKASELIAATEFGELDFDDN